jgi:hypothetical protein
MMDEYQGAIKKLTEYLDQTVVFAKGELPDVAQQMLVYGSTTAHVWFYLFLALTVISIIMFIGICCAMSGDSDAAGAAVFMFIFVCLLSCATVSHYMAIVKIEKAPKLYIMEQMREMLRATN